MQSAHPRRWLALAVIATAQMMLILDASIVAVALPDTQLYLRASVLLGELPRVVQQLVQGYPQ